VGGWVCGRAQGCGKAVGNGQFLESGLGIEICCQRYSCIYNEIHHFSHRLVMLLFSNSLLNHNSFF